MNPLNEQTVRTTVAELRATFNSGVTKPIEWRKQQLKALYTLLDEHSTEFEHALREDLGKSEIESRLTEIAFVKGEITHTLKKLKKWLKPQKPVMPLSLQPAKGELIYEPLGVVLIIAPWNYPVMLIFSPLVGALAAGNTALLKPSEVTPTVAALIAKLVPEYLDPSAIKVLEANAEETGYILAERFDYIFYTGNDHVAKIVMTAAAKYLTPLTLELGGKSPVWIDEKVNLKAVANRLAWSKYLNAGQTCVAPDYILTTPKVAEQLTKYLAKSLKRMYGKNPEKNVDYCHIVNQRHTERLQQLLNGLDSEQIVIGGKVDVANNYVAPTVVDNVSLDAPIMQTEIFGPILPIIRVDSFDEALKVILSKEKPLALYAFTNDKKIRERILRETSSGSVGFNIAVAQLSSPDLPFGGIGMSGTGAYHGKYSLATFSHLKPVLSKPLWFDTIRFITAPYGYITKLVIKLFISK